MEKNTNEHAHLHAGKEAFFFFFNLSAPVPRLCLVNFLLEKVLFLLWLFELVQSPEINELRGNDYVTLTHINDVYSVYRTEPGRHNSPSVPPVPCELCWWSSFVLSTCDCPSIETPARLSDSQICFWRSEVSSLLVWPWSVWKMRESTFRNI